jgi:uncharacterized protein (DUF1800 family)
MKSLCLSLCLLAASSLASADENSLRPLPKDQWNRSAAAHLLTRAGFGGSAHEIERVYAMGMDEAVRGLIEYRDIPFATQPPPFPAELAQPEDRAARRAMTEEERRAYEEKRRRIEREAFEETRLWWVERMVTTTRPLEEKMTLFWHGQFTSGMREVRNPVYMKEQNDFLRANAMGTFRDLLCGISRDRAMLVYLDGNRNNKDQPNENYARELLELFTLGVGNYSEQDIKAAARAFTGWHAGDDGFVFRGRNHDYGEKTFLKRTGKFDGDDIVDIILDQPACARFLARNLLEFFVRPDPDKKLIGSVAGELQRSKYDLRATMNTLLRSEAFYASSARGSLVKSPVELVVGTARRLEVPLNNLLAAERAIARMGQELMQPPNVKGWDGDEKWINTATLFARYNLIGALLAGGEPGPRTQRMAARDAADDANDEQAGGMMSMDTARTRLAAARQPAFDALKPLREYNRSTPDEIIDFYVEFLLPRPLPSPKRDQLLAYLGTDFSLNAKGAPERLRTLVHLICSTPEYQMN